MLLTRSMDNIMEICIVCQFFLGKSMNMESPRSKTFFLFLLFSTFCLSDFQTTNTYMKAEGSKQEVKEEQTTNTCMKDEGSQQGVEELEELFKLLSELDLLYSHYLEEQLSMILELLLTSPKMQPELWRR